MRINFAHLRDQGIDFAVFEADARTHMNSDRASVLADLTARARLQGLRVDKSALAYQSGRRVEFYGTPDLVRYLSGRGVPLWTHSMEVE